MEFSTIYDLVHGLDETEILAACAKSDPDFADNYPAMLKELKAIEPKRTTINVIVRHNAIPDETQGSERVSTTEWYDVSGEEFGDNETFYAIEFMPWAEWLGSTFSISEGVDLTPVQILAECLNEMTWGGWTQAALEEHRDDIMGKAAEVQDLLDEDNK